MKRENKVINRTSQVSKFINDLHKYDSNICRLTILLNPRKFNKDSLFEK